jgi:hypothetical protein
MIQKEDIRNAIECFDRKIGVPPRFVDSTRFDILFDGERFPPKTIIAMAAERPVGRILEPDNFSGGESSSAFRILLDRGFEIATKKTPIENLDATFSVGRNSETEFLIVECRGPNRNKDYLIGLESLLSGLADADAILTDAIVDSTQSRGMSRKQCRLKLNNRSYPIRLRTELDILALRRELTAAASQTARNSESSGGGNPTKRLRLEIQVPEERTLVDIQLTLSTGANYGFAAPEPFRFAAGPPKHRLGSSERKALDSATVTYLHARMQKTLYETLAEKSGHNNVASEQVMANGRVADLVVRTSEGLVIYEIKTSKAPVDCVRQALGQLLEYGCWPGSEPLAELWVVGPAEIDKTTNDYLEGLRNHYNLPIQYMRQSDEWG